MNRRELFKRTLVAGGAAALYLAEHELEPIRRFWPGYGPNEADIVVAPLVRGESMFQRYDIICLDHSKDLFLITNIDERGADLMPWMGPAMAGRIVNMQELAEFRGLGT